uniref:Uncharacterized protein n=1 Tax=Sphaerodactylus townsendi TaxID=933632 RepID=A0ACB8G4H2_9SAUR
MSGWPFSAPTLEVDGMPGMGSMRTHGSAIQKPPMKDPPFPRMLQGGGGARQQRDPGIFLKPTAKMGPRLYGTVRRNASLAPGIKADQLSRWWPALPRLHLLRFPTRYQLLPSGKHLFVFGQLGSGACGGRSHKPPPLPE